MKLSIQLKLGQQLTMTPQLQQAIRLLQLSTLDLQQEIHQALESNPMLELIENNEEEEEEEEDGSFNRESNNQPLNGEEQSWQEQIPRDLAVRITQHHNRYAARPPTLAIKSDPNVRTR